MYLQSFIVYVDKTILLKLTIKFSGNENSYEV